ncbi:YfhO family protein [Nitrospirillum amazonense]|nr:YfhO family protein [Nitrospirillum amazonense]
MPAAAGAPPDRNSRNGFRTAFILAVLMPVLAKLHQILHLRLANPALMNSDLVTGLNADGVSSLDPNVGFTSQTLGHRAALDLLSGHLPWWNPYEGVGMPLAGEMQSAALFPLTPLLALPDGQLYMHIAMQIIAGIFTVLLMRRLGTDALAAGTAALLFEFNGTYAWLANAVINPICFLPMILLGVEDVRLTVIAGREGTRRGGWGWIGLGVALSLYAGFPEMAYLDGLLAAAWTMARLPGLERRQAAMYLARLALGVGAGVLLAAPILIAFLGYLPHAFVGAHGGEGYRYVRLGQERLITLLMPYLHGRLTDATTADAGVFWGRAGGYIGMMMPAMAVMGLWARRWRGLRLTLGAWSLFTIATLYGVPGLTHLVTAVPMVTNSIFTRYLPPSFEFALAVLAGLACHDLASHDLAQAGDMRRLWARPLFRNGAAALALLVLAAAVLSWGRFNDAAVLTWYRLSMGCAAALALGVCILAFPRLDGRRQALGLAAFTVVEAIALFLVPAVWTVRAGTLQLGGIHFLRQNLGLQRFYTLGPIQPNYGSFYGVASLNHDDLPLPAAWTRYVHDHLDDNTTGVTFGPYGHLDPSRGSQAQNLMRNLDAFREVGVKYVVAPPGISPFGWDAGQDPNDPGHQPLRLDDGTRVTLEVPDYPAGNEVHDVSVMLGTYGDKSDGALLVTACRGDVCATGRTDLATARDGRYARISLDHPLLPGSAPVTLEWRKSGGAVPVVIWAIQGHAGRPRALALDGVPKPGWEAVIGLGSPVPAFVDAPIYSDAVMDIYEMRQPPAPYFQADGCAIDATVRVQAAVDCPAPATLTRRELYLPGWTATVNGQDSPVLRQGELFQRVALPAGRSVVEFHFRPPFMPLGYAAFAAGLLLTALGWRTWRGREKASRAGS